MNTMKCFECALKHTSTALSYGKEILSGHGEGADLDHRIDFLGQITNLEHHLKLLDENLLLEVKNYREMLQAKKVNVDESDLNYLRELYHKIEQIQEGEKGMIKHESSIDSTPCVLFLKITNKNYFDLCYKKLKENLIDYSNIYYLQSDIDLTGYDVAKIDYNDIQEQFVYIIKENDIILHQISAKALLRIQDFESSFAMQNVIKELKKNQPYFYYDNFPMVVKKSDFQQFIDKDAPLTYYGNKYKADYEYKVFQVGVKLDKVLCCSNKQRIKTAIYCCIMNDTAFDSISTISRNY